MMISEVAHKLNEVRDFLKPFVSMESVRRVEVGEDGEQVTVDEGVKPLAYVDEKGRTVGEGKRKEAKARVYLTKMSAKTDKDNVTSSTPYYNAIKVNHKSLSVYFMRMRDRVEVCKPFEVTNTFGKYQLDCFVDGGGHTGVQSIHVFRSRWCHQNWIVKGIGINRSIPQIHSWEGRIVEEGFEEGGAQKVWSRKGKEKVHLVHTCCG